MPALLLHFFDKDDPNGDTIFECSTDDEFVKQVQLKIERDSMGGGTVNFARKTGTGLISRNIVVPETLVRVVIPEIDSDKYLWGFFINPRQQQVVSKAEKGGEGFTFGGPGPKHYLSRAVLRAQSFTGIQDAIDDVGGVWVWPETASAGRILSRLISEDAAATAPTSMLPDLTKTFNLTQDSDSVAWVDDISSNQDFSLNIGDDFLKLMWILEDASGMITHIDLGSVGSPTLQLEAWQTKGRDLTGDLAADTVHWIEGVNIASDLNVEGQSFKKASHALVIGNEGQYTIAQRPGYSAGELKKTITTSYPSTNDDVLERAGQRFLNRQENGERAINLKIVPGWDPVNGLYMFGPPGTDGHFWLWDTVDLTTGQASPTVLDYQAEPQAVTGIHVELEKAVRDDDALAVARSLDVKVVLNKERESSNTARDLVGNRGTTSAPCNCVRLCAVAHEGATSTSRLYFSNDGIGFNPAVDAAWDDDDTGGQCKTLKLTPDATYGTGHNISDTGPGSTSDVCKWQGAYGPLSSADAALIAAGGLTVHGQITTRMRSGAGISESSQHGISQMGIRVTNGASTTIRGTALALHALSIGSGANEWRADTTHQNREFPASPATDTLSAVAACVAGDYLIFEIGVRNYTTVTTGSGIRLTSSAAGDLPEDETTTTPLNAWIDLISAGVGGTEGAVPEDTVRQGEGAPGTSSRAARCDHQHEHGLLSTDGLHYHNREDIEGSDDLTLDELSDVDTAGVADGDVLVWDATDGLWLPSAPTGGSGSLDVQEGGVSVEAPVDEIDFGSGFDVSTPGTGRVAVALDLNEVDTKEHNHTGTGDGGDLDSPVIDGFALFNEESAPSTPSSGTVAVYAKSDGKLYSKADDGVERGPFDAATGSGGIVPWNIRPDYGMVHVSYNTLGLANRTVYVPCIIPVDCTVEGLGFRNNAASGNIVVALYNESLNQVATSGAVTTPAATINVVNFTSPYAATAGRYFMAVGSPNNTTNFSNGASSVYIDPGNYIENVYPPPSSMATPLVKGGNPFNFWLKVSGGLP